MSSNTCLSLEKEVLSMPFLAIAILTVQAAAQVGSSPPRSSDVVVTAPGDRRSLPTATVPATNGSLKNRINFENSQKIAKCAMRLPVERLRSVLDGAPNSAPQREAQAWLVRQTATCNSDTRVLSQLTRGTSSAVNASIGAGLGSLESNLASIGVGGENEIVRSASGISVYDYGAFLQAALETFAPGLALTTRETSDPAVQARFNTREESRNAQRQVADYKYFETAVCMVRLQPERATQLYNAKPGSVVEGRIRSMLISDARACVGNARKVYVDATQFRIYVTDALYRWTLAARDVSSLLPKTDVAAR